MTEQRLSADGETFVRSARFSTEHERSADQLEIWRGIVASMTDVEPLDGSRKGFNGSVEIHDLDKFSLAAFTMDPCHFRHTTEHVRKSGVDQWFLTLVKKGPVSFDVEDERLDASAGSVCFNSFSYPFSGVTTGTSFTSLFINRDDFGDVADVLDRACHRQVTGPMALVLSEFLAAVDGNLPDMGARDVGAVNEALTSLVRAVLVKDADAVAAARQPIAAARFELARRFISENLKSPRLNADALCSQLGMSRRQLYYLFERHGGVASFIRKRRLAACYSRLKDVTEKNAIGAIAYDYGFTNLSSFYRQFQAQYGLRPSEVRAAWLSGHKPGAATAATFTDWLTRGGGV